MAAISQEFMSDAKSDDARKKTSLMLNDANYRRFAAVLKEHTKLEISQGVDMLIAEFLERWDTDRIGKSNKSIETWLDITGVSPSTQRHLQVIASLDNPDEYEEDILSLIPALQERRERRGRHVLGRPIVHKSPTNK